MLGLFRYEYDQMHDQMNPVGRILSRVLVSSSLEATDKAREIGTSRGNHVSHELLSPDIRKHVRRSQDAFFAVSVRKVIHLWFAFIGKTKSIIVVAFVFMLGQFLGYVEPTYITQMKNSSRREAKRRSNHD